MLRSFISPQSTKKHPVYPLFSKGNKPSRRHKAPLKRAVLLTPQRTANPKKPPFLPIAPAYTANNLSRPKQSYIRKKTSVNARLPETQKYFHCKKPETTNSFPALALIRFNSGVILHPVQSDILGKPKVLLKPLALVVFYPPKLPKAIPLRSNITCKANTTRCIGK